MKAKKQPVPARSCPARPRGAARPTGPFCNPPDPEDARGHCDLSKSPRAALCGAHVPGTRQRLAPKGGQLRGVKCRQRGAVPGGAVDNTLKMLTLAQGKLHVCLKKSVGGNREGEASYHFTVHTYLSRTYQEIFASNFPLFNVRMWVRQADF